MKSRTDSTVLQTNLIVTMVADWIASGCSPGEIAARLSRQMQEPIDNDLFEKIVFLAKQYIQSSMDIPKNEMKERIGRFFLDRMADEDSKVADRLKSAENLCNLLGLGAKYETDDVDPMDRAAQVNDALEQIRKQHKNSETDSRGEE